MSAGTISVLGLVESKGTNRPTYPYHQVYTGAGQIAETWQAGFPAVPGIVVATQSGREEMKYVTARVDPLTATMQTPIEIGEELGSALLGSTWAKLADLAEDDALYERVAPPTRRARRTSASRPTSGRTQRWVGERAYEGTEATIPLPGGQLRLFLGADAEVLSALRHPEPDHEAAAEALTATARISRSRTALASELARSSDEVVAATTEDGAAIVLEAL